MCGRQRCPSIGAKNQSGAKAIWPGANQAAFGQWQRFAMQSARFIK